MDEHTDPRKDLDSRHTQQKSHYGATQQIITANSHRSTQQTHTAGTHSRPIQKIHTTEPLNRPTQQTKHTAGTNNEGHTAALDLTARMGRGIHRVRPNILPKKT